MGASNERFVSFAAPDKILDVFVSPWIDQDSKGVLAKAYPFLDLRHPTGLVKEFSDPITNGTAPGSGPGGI